MCTAVILIKSRIKIFIDDVQGHTSVSLMKNDTLCLKPWKMSFEQVFCHQSQAFKINMSFSYILQNRETGEYRFFYASNNEQLLNIPKLIRNQEDLNKLLDHLESKDYPTFLKQHCPNSKWTIERIVNLRAILYLIDFPLGRLPKLPAYIRQNRFIIGLEKHAHNSQ